MAAIFRQSPARSVPADEVAHAAPVSAAWLPSACDDIHNDQIRIVAFRDGTRPSFALLAARDVLVRVNGLVVVAGMRVLQHKDELWVGAEQMFFSAESTPVAEIFQGNTSKRPSRCPICRDAMRDGQQVVRCPGCSRLFHQIEATNETPARLCWTYLSECKFCEHPTSMTGEPTWRPDEEEFS